MEAVSQVSVPDAVRHNPFRVLGCLSSATTKERISSRNRLAAFARVGRQCAFPTDFDGFFGKIPRSPKDIEAAERALDLPEDRIRHAFFWFCRTGPVDEAALGRLQAGDMEKAVNMWERRRSASANINLSVLALCRDDVRGAVALVLPVIHDEAKRTALLSMLGLEAAHHDEAALLRIYVGALGDFLPWKRIHDAVVQSGSGDDVAYVRAAAVAPSLRRIESAIASRDVETCGPEDGKGLLQETKDDLELVDGILAKGDLDRRMVHDRLAKKLMLVAKETRADSPVQDECLALLQRAVGLAEGENALAECMEAKQAVANRRNAGQNGIGAFLKSLFWLGAFLALVIFFSH